MNTLLMGAVAREVAGVAPPDPAEPPPQGASLQVFPFFHIGGLSGLYVNTAIGSKLVTMYKWDVDTAIDLLVGERITSTAMVPTVLRQLLESPRIDTLPADVLAGIASGGAPGAARPDPPHRDRSSSRRSRRPTATGSPRRPRR